jgi:Uma2 family endonuclease
MDVRTARARFTRADYARLPEGFPAQLVDGCLLKDPSPTYGHQWIVGRIYRRAAALVGDLAVPSPIDVAIDDWNVYQPDVVVVPHVPDSRTSNVGIPRVAFEVLSRSTARRDRVQKLPRLLAAGVEEVWLLDPNAKSIEVHTSQGVRTARGAEQITSAAITGFELVPEELFDPPRE